MIRSKCWPVMATPRKIENCEDKGSDFSDREAQITLSLSHLDSENILDANSDSDRLDNQSNCSARRS